MDKIKVELTKVMKEIKKCTPFGFSTSENAYIYWIF